MGSTSLRGERGYEAGVGRRRLLSVSSRVMENAQSCAVLELSPDLSTLVDFFNLMAGCVFFSLCSFHFLLYCNYFYYLSLIRR